MKKLWVLLLLSTPSQVKGVENGWWWAGMTLENSFSGQFRHVPGVGRLGFHQLLTGMFWAEAKKKKNLQH